MDERGLIMWCAKSYQAAPQWSCSKASSELSCFKAGSSVLVLFLLVQINGYWLHRAKTMTRTSARKWCNQIQSQCRKSSVRHMMLIGLIHVLFSDFLCVAYVSSRQTSYRVINFCTETCVRNIMWLLSSQFWQMCLDWGHIKEHGAGTGFNINTWVRNTEEKIFLFWDAFLLLTDTW